MEKKRLRTKVLSLPWLGGKSFWSFVKSFRNNAGSVPTLIMNDKALTDPVEMANLLTGLFAGNFYLPASTQPLPELERL